MRRRPDCSKWPDIIEQMLESGEPVRAVVRPSADSARAVRKKLVNIYGAEESGFEVMARRNVVYIINKCAVGVE